MKTVLSSIYTVLWWLACVLLTIDTGCFIYPSLSQTLTGYLCILLLCVVGWVHGVFTKAHVSLNMGTCLLLCWLIYLCFHARLIADAEVYKLSYMVSGLLFTLTLSQLLHRGTLTFSKLENGFLLMLILQLMCLLLQMTGVMSSYNSYFPLTGFSDNPNATAMMIAVCIPLIYDRLKTSDHTYSLLALLVVSFIFLVILRCRTAYIGLAVICVVRIALSDKAKTLYQRLGKKTLYVSFAFLLLLLSFSAALYKMKQDSSDGRLLVWKVSAGMLAEKPEGWGIGLYEKYYNLCQGEYFSAGKPSEKEKYLASTVYMAYNDLLEHGVEAGWCGTIFMILFYVSMAVRAYRTRKIVAFSVICGFLVMSLVNFVYATIQPWFILLCYVADVLGCPQGSFCVGKKVKSGIHLVALFFSFFLLWQYAELTIAQVRLKHYEHLKDIGQKVELKAVEELASPIGTSEGYYRFLSSLYMRDGEYEKAAEALRKAMDYTSEPELFFALFNCYDKMGMTAQGIEYIKTIRDMLPQNMMSRNILLRWYDSQGMKVEALAVAHEMAETPLKVKSSVTESYQQGARRYIEKESKIKESQ